MAVRKLKKRKSPQKSDNLSNGGKGAKGGRREGSGRKPKAATILKRKLQADHALSAADAFNLLDRFMRDEALDPALRRQCANDILDRVLGKPKQAVDVNLQRRILVLDLE